MRYVRVEAPQPISELQTEAPEAPQTHQDAAQTPQDPLHEQIVRFVWSVGRLPFRVIAQGDRFYVEYAFPFACSMLSRGTSGSIAERRLATCRACPFIETKTRGRFEDVQVGIGVALWGLALWWLVGPWLALLGGAWIAWAATKRKNQPGEFCGQCHCGTHGLARLDFKVKRRGSTCPVGLWEPCHGKL